MQALIIAKGEFWLHAGVAASWQVTSSFAREVVERDERPPSTSCPTAR